MLSDLTLLLRCHDSHVKLPVITLPADVLKIVSSLHPSRCNFLVHDLLPCYALEDGPKLELLPRHVAVVSASLAC